MSETAEILDQAGVRSANEIASDLRYSWSSSFWQFVRFGAVGSLNTALDVLTLNVLLWSFPTHNVNLLLTYNSMAYTLGALNSFCLNKYWTFRTKRVIRGGELLRFAAVTIGGMFCSDSIMGMVARILHPSVTDHLLWVNVSKGCAVVGTMILSYLGMRLWVFTNIDTAGESFILARLNRAIMLKLRSTNT